MRFVRSVIVLGLSAVLSLPAVLAGQPAFDSSGLLAATRRAAALVPGDFPTSINFVSPHPGIRVAKSYAVEGESVDSVSVIYPVFQIRFPRGWIIAESALDHAFFANSKTFSDAKYDSIQQAMRNARLVIVTHEHHDHVAGIVRSPYLSEIQQHTLLTKPQLRSLLERPNDPRIKIDSLTASRFIAIDYEPLMPIAPGVVLVKAAGHTPGSQMVYVRLVSGAEYILAGDVAWHMSGVMNRQQKPETSTRGFGGEDRAAIARQLDWLRSAVASGVIVAVSHDGEWINRLAERGVLHAGFDFTNP